MVCVNFFRTRLISTLRSTRGFLSEKWIIHARVAREIISQLGR